MCSAIQPSFLAMVEAIRNARHFFPSRALPPYPDPYDQILFSSVKWEMYFCSIGAQGHFPLSVSCSPNGFPTECRQGMNSPSSPKTSNTSFPTRVMMCMLITT